MFDFFLRLDSHTLLVGCSHLFTFHDDVRCSIRSVNSMVMIIFSRCLMIARVVDRDLRLESTRKQNGTERSSLVNSPPSVVDLGHVDGRSKSHGDTRIEVHSIAFSQLTTVIITARMNAVRPHNTPTR